MRKKSILILIPILLLVLNFVLKFLYVDSQSIAGDEPFSIFHAQLNVASIIEQLKQGNNPPLFEIMLHYWIQLFGISPTSVRFLSLIFSTVTVYFIYKIGISFFNQRIAIVGSLLFTFSNYQLFFSHECRVYSLFALLTAISMYAFFKLQQDRNNVKYLILMTLSNVLLIYSHYFGFWVIFIQIFITLLFRNNRKNLLKPYALGLFILAIAYFPMWGTFFERFLNSTVQGTWLSPPKNLGNMYYMLWLFSNRPLNIITFSIFAIFIVSLIKFLVKKDHSQIITFKSEICILIWFALPFLLMFIISFKAPMFHDRYLVFLSVAFYILLAIGIDYLLPKFKYRYVLDAVVILMFILTFNPNVDNQRHVKETVAKVKELKDENTLVVISAYHFMPNFAYYYNIDYFKLADNKDPYKQMNSKLRSENVYSVYSIEEIPKATLNEFSKIVFLDAAADFANPNNNIRKTLDSRFEQMDKYSFYEIFNVYLYEKKGCPKSL